MQAAREKRMYARRMMGTRKKHAMDALETIKKHNKVVEGPLAGFKQMTTEQRLTEKPFTLQKMDESN